MPGLPTWLSRLWDVVSSEHAPELDFWEACERGDELFCQRAPVQRHGIKINTLKPSSVYLGSLS